MLMSGFKHISAFLFLSIFSMFLLHQVLPHNHHELTDAIEISGHHHSHAHSHDHDKEESKDSNDHSGLLAFLLGTHSHAYHSNDFQLRNELKPQIRTKDLYSFVLPQFQLYTFERHKEKLKPVSRCAPGYRHPNLSTPFLRGPPALG